MQSTQLKTKTNICKICFREIEQNSFHSLFYKNSSICHNCLVLLQPSIETFKLEGIKYTHIYFYNEKIQSLLYQFKGCKDYELKTVFLEYYKAYLNILFNGYYIIPAPSYKKSDKERGFNHVTEMFSILNMKQIKCIHKTKKIKQADLTTKERENISKYLVIDDIDLSNKKILLVDDVYTTGSTIKAMINLVKQKGAKKIRVLLMSKTIDLDKR